MKKENVLVCVMANREGHAIIPSEQDLCISLNVPVENEKCVTLRLSDFTKLKRIINELAAKEIISKEDARKYRMSLDQATNLISKIPSEEYEPRLKPQANLNKEVSFSQALTKVLRQKIKLRSSSQINFILHNSLTVQKPIKNEIRPISRYDTKDYNRYHQLRSNLSCT